MLNTKIFGTQLLLVYQSKNIVLYYHNSAQSKSLYSLSVLLTKLTDSYIL